MHLIISANHFSILFLGGWSGFNLWLPLPVIFYSIYDINYYNWLFN
jgi:NADH:ubiquinone oxidoreductase subunit H